MTSRFLTAAALLAVGCRSRSAPVADPPDAALTAAADAANAADAGTHARISYVQMVTGGHDGLEVGFALTSDGRIRGWGSGVNQLLEVTTRDADRLQTVSSIDDAVAIDMTDGFTACALRRSGEVWCWGSGAALGDGTRANRGEPRRVAELTGVKQIASGGSGVCARTEAGEVHCWGGFTSKPGESSNIVHTLPLKIDIPHATSITGAYSYFGAITDGGVYLWGDWFSGSDKTTGPKVAKALAGAKSLASHQSLTCLNAIDEHGGLLVVPGCKSKPMKAAQWPDLAAAPVDGAFRCAITTAATLRCEPRSDSRTFLVDGAHDVKSIGHTDSSGREAVCFVDGSGDACCWGDVKEVLPVATTRGALRCLPR